MSISLTPKQRQLFEFIREAIAVDGCCPSYLEMQQALGLAGKSGIHRLIIGLEQRGAIRRLPNKARAIEIVEQGNRQSLPRIVACAKRRFASIIMQPYPAHHRHLNAFLAAVDLNPLEFESGFITSEGQFVGGAEAKRIAMAAGQMKSPTNSSHLFSEDLW
jgi:hypothetical protein